MKTLMQPFSLSPFRAGGRPALLHVSASAPAGREDGGRRGRGRRGEGPGRAHPDAALGRLLVVQERKQCDNIVSAHGGVGGGAAAGHDAAAAAEGQLRRQRPESVRVLLQRSSGNGGGAGRGGLPRRGGRGEELRHGHER